MNKLDFLVLLIFTVFIVSNTNAQDKIILKNGVTIEAKVLEINKSTVKYKKLNNLEGPTFVEDKSGIQIILYENGENEIFEESSVQKDDHADSVEKGKIDFGRNRFEASLVGAGFASHRNDYSETFGAFISGASYERILDDAGLLGLKMKGELGFTEYEDIIMTFGVALNVYPFKSAKWLYVGPSVKYGTILLYDDYSEYEEFLSYGGLGLGVGSQFQINRLFGIRGGMEYFLNNFFSSDFGDYGEFQFQLGFNFSF